MKNRFLVSILLVIISAFGCFSLFVYAQESLEAKPLDVNWDKTYNVSDIEGHKLLVNEMKGQEGYRYYSYDMNTKTMTELLTIKRFIIESNDVVRMGSQYFTHITAEDRIQGGANEFYKIDYGKNEVKMLSSVQEWSWFYPKTDFNGEIAVLHPNANPNTKIAEPYITLCNPETGVQQTMLSSRADYNKNIGTDPRYLSSSDGKLYVLTNIFEKGKSRYQIQVYNSQFKLLNTIDTNNIYEIFDYGTMNFYVMGPYVFVKNLSGYGVLAKINGSTLEKVSSIDRVPCLVETKAGSTLDFRVFYFYNENRYMLLKLDTGEMITKTIPIKEGYNTQYIVGDDSGLLIRLEKNDDASKTLYYYWSLQDFEKYMRQ